ncbi:MAG: 3-hydroxyacyl-CoA dehydrogenase [Phyllobacteriaceae bacterium]|jgi:3-hydroxyacyl-CoA dehydrogenase|nr:3-hydroxyacyl-CoA dehydrogenase [Phyllobacteriaceae bacterium]
MAHKTAIIGTGLIGQAWAMSFATAGHRVILWDQNDQAVQSALNAIKTRLQSLREYGLFDEDVATVAQRIVPAESLQDAIADVDHVQENVAEDLEIKRSVLMKLDDLAPNSAVIASSTSALLPSALFDGFAGAARCLVAHPINPPNLIRAVELVGSPSTSMATYDRCAALLRSAGHEIVRLDREIDGFVVNRLQGALLDEAFRLVEAGIASPHAVDAAIKDGLANRWVIMGPFETIDLNAPGGVRDYVERYGPMYDRLAVGGDGRPDWTKAVDVIAQCRRSRLPIDQIEDRSRWRDEQLMRLRVHKRQAGLEANHD